MGPGFGTQSKDAASDNPQSGGDKIDGDKAPSYAPTVKAQEVRPPTINNLPKGITLVNEFYDNKFGRA